MNKTLLVTACVFVLMVALRTAAFAEDRTAIVAQLSGTLESVMRNKKLAVCTGDIEKYAPAMLGEPSIRCREVFVTEWQIFEENLVNIKSPFSLEVQYVPSPGCFMCTGLPSITRLIYHQGEADAVEITDEELKVAYAAAISHIALEPRGFDHAIKVATIDTQF